MQIAYNPDPDSEQQSFLVEIILGACVLLVLGILVFNTRSKEDEGPPL
jgi:hypothetical protein